MSRASHPPGAVSADAPPPAAGDRLSPEPAHHRSQLSPTGALVITTESRQPLNQRQGDTLIGRQGHVTAGAVQGPDIIVAVPDRTVTVPDRTVSVPDRAVTVPDRLG